MEPKISVVLCERNSEAFIEECIESIMTQSFKDFELIVVDDFSTDSTKEKIKRMQKKYPIKLIELREHSGISKARNRGIQEAKGKFIAFIDVDCTAERNWLSELIKCFDAETASVGGPNIIPKKANKKEKIFHELLEFISGIGSSYVKTSKKAMEVEHNPSCNSMYSKKVLKEMKGFNEKLSSNEDAELDFRIKKTGKKIKFNPKAIVYHHRKDSAKKIFAQAFWFGLGRMQAIKIHLGMLEWFRVLPSIAILCMLSLLVYAILSTQINLFLYFVSLVFFVFVVISFLASLKYKRASVDYFIFLVAWFFGYGLGMIRGIK
jgi:glycosyltransferase involved in cell wall biosynthesis